eukprot:gnl/TRDRNA2_/TRDRNA2_166379_c1_seq2.p1 gnl/TRDRNA2_/TRDRNA2_166379_c1~~gnl/TRDRNA2_/TRDRNA2_166379_c1_seq2.p1  ORF type:complete len:340 (+),score=41.11 gnl/TRDRNA2_/TRDRNA2_166379_c1_seq2:71-1090(+)
MFEGRQVENRGECAPELEADIATHQGYEACFTKEMQRMRDKLALQSSRVEQLEVQVAERDTLLRDLRLALGSSRSQVEKLQKFVSKHRWSLPGDVSNVGDEVINELHDELRAKGERIFELQVTVLELRTTLAKVQMEGHLTRVNSTKGFSEQGSPGDPAWGGSRMRSHTFAAPQLIQETDLVVHNQIPHTLSAEAKATIAARHWMNWTDDQESLACGKALAAQQSRFPSFADTSISAPMLRGSLRRGSGGSEIIGRRRSSSRRVSMDDLKSGGSIDLDCIQCDTASVPRTRPSDFASCALPVLLNDTAGAAAQSGAAAPKIIRRPLITPRLRPSRRTTE